ncbi:Iron(III) dicitrate transport system permease protein FecD (TC 3.A.1.14.1) [Escherichia coli ISC41]|nr:Iron(III) dicitrate transport system permease protein FecD (TC 3.A.1.14.1) [Escherichia coli ISC41]
MTVLESTLSVENRYRQLFRQRLVILAVIFIAIMLRCCSISPSAPQGSLYIR